MNEKVTKLPKIPNKITGVSNSLDPDQTWCFVRADLDPNCLQIKVISADDTTLVSEAN